MVNLKIYRGVGVSSTFLAVMRCSYQFFAVLRYSEPPNAPPSLSYGSRRSPEQPPREFEKVFVTRAGRLRE